MATEGIPPTRLKRSWMVWLGVQCAYLLMTIAADYYVLGMQDQPVYVELEVRQLQIRHRELTQVLIVLPVIIFIGALPYRYGLSVKLDHCKRGVSW